MLQQPSASRVPSDCWGICTATCPASSWTGSRYQDLSPNVLVDKEGIRMQEREHPKAAVLSQKLREPASAGSLFGGSVEAELVFGQLLVFPFSSRNCRNVLCFARLLPCADSLVELHS